MELERTFKLEITRRGLPALWEEGGGMTNSGSAQVVAGPDGGRKKPLVVRGGAFGPHALFVVSTGDLIIRAHWSRASGSEIYIYKITAFLNDEDGRRIALAKSTHTYVNGEWEPIAPQGELAEAVKAAREKASCYHCRSPHWSLQ